MGRHTKSLEIVEELVQELRALNTTGETASVLRTTRRNLYRLVATGELKAIQARPGGALLIPRSSIVAFVESRLGG